MNEYEALDALTDRYPSVYIHRTDDLTGSNYAWTVTAHRSADLPDTDGDVLASVHRRVKGGREHVRSWGATRADALVKLAEFLAVAS